MSERKRIIPSDLGPCACSQVRRTARKLSLLYDRMLNPSGITVTQHAVLVNVDRAGQVSRTELAAHLGMDRTTLTRNLSPLEKAGLLVTVSSIDRRERLLSLSPAGARKLRHSYSLWEETQRQFIAELGNEPLAELRSLLRAAESAAEAIKNQANKKSQ